MIALLALAAALEVIDQFAKAAADAGRGRAVADGFL
jgi:hypothetical protein